MLSLKVGKHGNSLGVTLPREAAAALRVADGDRLFLTEAPGGGYRLTAYDPTFERHMAAADEVAKRRRDALRELAKR
jgi:putative addiction module antidote